MTAGVHFVQYSSSENILRFSCPACDDDTAKVQVLTVEDTEHGGGGLTLYRCSKCRSLSYFPFPQPDYTSHTGPLRLRDYVEMGASIDGPASNLLRVMKNGRKGRMIDIGCGFGFAVDVVRTLRGWDVRGFEPSQYGAAGRSQLGVDIINDFAWHNPDPADLYDVVHCSEVIEHVFDAKAFVDLLVSYLAPDGVLVLTTPNPDRIMPETPEAHLLPLLSPGDHTILFSAGALTRLFNDVGFAHVHVEPGAISSLFYASRRPIAFQPMDGWRDELSTYLLRAADRSAPGTPLETGLRYRAFRAACDQGKFDLAEQMIRPGMADPDPRLDDIETVEQFAARWPFCIAAATYYVGMYLLLHKADFAEAARHFAAAHRLCHRKIAVAPSSSVVEADLVWRAMYHKALAEKLNDDERSAGETLVAFSAPSFTPPLPPDLEPAIAALRVSLQ